jgi:hypothetical protein
MLTFNNVRLNSNLPDAATNPFKSSRIDGFQVTERYNDMKARSLCGLVLISAVLCPSLTLAAEPRLAAPGLSVSVLEFMRACVEIPADGIWAAAGADKLSADEWLLADQDSVDLLAAAALLLMPGTGKHDRAWVSNADWQGWVRDYKKAAMDIRTAVKARDLKQLAPAGDRLTQVCESCHSKYRPASPSDGVNRYPFYPKRELPQ